MVTTKTDIVLLLIAATCSLLLTEATSPPVPEPFAFGPSEDPLVSECYHDLLNMSDCVIYLKTAAGNNKTKFPEKACCPEFARLMERHGFCMCFLFADQLPSYCGDSVPIARCNAGSGTGILPFPIGGDDYNNGVSSGVGIYALVLSSIVVSLSIFFGF